jgi:hypothetical protein
MLDKEVIAYLREHPDAFSRVLAHVLGDKDAVASFQGKRKAFPDEEDRRVRPRLDEVFPPLAPDVWTNDLVEDMRHVIIEKLFEDMTRDDRVFIDLLMLGLVTKGLHKEVEKRLRLVESQISVVPLLCRALFEHARDHDTFRYFLGHVKDLAPAAYAAWLLLSTDATIRDDVGSVLDFLQRERPRHFQGALERNGVDPIATVLCMHHMVPREKQLSPLTFKRLSTLALDKIWAVFMTPLREQGRPPRVSVSQFEEAFHACVVRSELAETLQEGQSEFKTTFEWFTERVSPHAEALVSVPKEFLQRLARLDADLLIFVAIRFREVIPETASEIEDLVYRWFRYKLLPQEDYEQPPDLQKLRLLAVELKNIVEQLDASAFPIVSPRIKSARARYLARFTNVQWWPAHFDIMMRNVPIEFMRYAVRAGNVAFIKMWFETFWPVYRASFESAERLARVIVLECTKLEWVAKHLDAAVKIQPLVTAFLRHEMPEFASPGTWEAYKCIGPELLSYLANGKSERRKQRLLEETRRARDLFDALTVGTITWLEQRFKLDAGLFLALAEIEYLILLGARLAKFRPDFMRRIFDAVFRMVAQLTEEDSLKVFDFMMRVDFGGRRVVWYFVRSDLFERHWHEQELNSFGLNVTYLLQRCKDKNLTLAHHLFADKDEAHVVNAVRTFLDQWMPPKSIYSNWNLAYRCISLPSYAEVERTGADSTFMDVIQDGTIEPEMILFYRIFDDLIFTTRLERLCIASEYGEFDE